MREQMIKPARLSEEQIIGALKEAKREAAAHFQACHGVSKP
jgi:hypothetical protein